MGTQRQRRARRDGGTRSSDASSELADYHRFVRHDGPVSIARCFVKDDWRAALRGAGIAQQVATIRWEIPFRLTVERIKNA